MNTSAVEKFSIWARRALREGVALRAMRYKLIGDDAAPADALFEVNGSAITRAEAAQRARLLGRIEREGEEAFLEEMAYTWFNRFIAIRYMEMHDYLPSRTRIFSNAAGEFRPQCLADVMSLDLPALDRSRVLELKLAGNDEPLFREILLAQCAQLHDCLPTVFASLDAADALMLPDGLLSDGGRGVAYHMVTDIPAEDWDNVEVLGWMYQFYNAERKDEFFDSKRKAAPDDLAPATQLFTPEWIVRYMTENSLGRLWMLNNPQSELARGMAYYIQPDEEHEDFIRVSSPEDITVCDPACGSGHILSYAFDLLYRMYEECGYRERDIPSLILTKNLAGMEIDPRAAQIATLVLAMRAREHDRRFFSRGVAADITVLESIELSEDELSVAPILAECAKLLDTLAHLGECGSLFAPTADDIRALQDAVDAIAPNDLFAQGLREKLVQALAACKALSRRFDVCIANPPYMGSSSFNPWMSKWVKRYYADVKSDLFSAFVVRIMRITNSHGEIGLMTPFVWMFISSYENLRNELIDKRTLTSLVQLEYSGFAGATVPICTFTFHNSHIEGYKGGYVRLSDFVGASIQGPKALEAIQNPDCGWFYRVDASTFHDIPGSPIAYWAGSGFHEAFKSLSNVEQVAHPKVGMQTSNNNKFLRLWWEVPAAEGFNSDWKWIKYLKGGPYKKWYGNLDHLLHYNNDSEYILKQPHAKVLPISMLSRQKITCTMLTSGQPSFRYASPDTFYDIAGHCAFPTNEDYFYLLGLLNSSFASCALKLLNPTMNMQVSDIGRIPFARSPINAPVVADLAERAVAISRSDWDSQETSWDFKRNPLV